MKGLRSAECGEAWISHGDLYAVLGCGGVGLGWFEVGARHA